MSHVWPIWPLLRAGIQYWHSSPRTNRRPKGRRDKKSETPWTPSKQRYFCYKGRGHRGHNRVQDDGLACDTTKARSPLRSVSLRNHTCPWDQFLPHHANVNGVILTCTNGRLEHNSSNKFYIFLCCFNASKQEILLSQTLLGRVTLLTPDQLLRSSDCSAWEGTCRYPHQLCYLATEKGGERFKRWSR